MSEETTEIAPNPEVVTAGSLKPSRNGSLRSSTTQLAAKKSATNLTAGGGLGASQINLLKKTASRFSSTTNVAQSRPKSQETPSQETSDSSVVPGADTTNPDTVSTSQNDGTLPPTSDSSNPSSYSDPPIEDEATTDKKTSDLMEKSLERISLSMQIPPNDPNNGEDEPFGEEVTIIPAVYRTLQSPEPSIGELLDSGVGVFFLNVEYDTLVEDESGGLINPVDSDEISKRRMLHSGGGLETGGDMISFMIGKMEKSGSLLESEMLAFEDEEQKDGSYYIDGYRRRHGDKTPMLRPTSPTYSEEDAKKKEEEEKTSAIAASGIEIDPIGEGGDGPVVEQEVDPLQAMIEEGINRETFIAQIKSSLDLKEKLKVKNVFFQNKLGEYFKRKRTEDTHDGEKSVTDQEQRYANCMSALQTLRTEYESINSSNQKIVNEYKLRLEERISEAHEKSTEFTKFKRSTALSAENSRTGKPIPAKLVETLEGTEQRKEMEVVSVRLDHIKLRNKLKRHEQLLRQKEELADGLHLIDFEQLKIENQTYNEKIEERNEELLKLRKKITNIVQVLTHVKEKLQFVQGENVALKKELRHLDDNVSERRDSLPQSKQQRDSLRASNTNLRQRNGLLGNNPLLRDFETKVDETDLLQKRIDELRAYHASLSAETLSVRRKIQRKLII